MEVYFSASIETYLELVFDWLPLLVACVGFG
jgi:hypothetical protein